MMFALFRTSGRFRGISIRSSFVSVNGSQSLVYTDALSLSVRPCDWTSGERNQLDIQLEPSGRE